MSGKRKNAHLQLALKQQPKQNDFDLLRLKHDSVPIINYHDVSLKTTILEHEFPYPFYINAMTGGTKASAIVNYKLAKLANHFGIPFFVGSQSIALKNANAAASFRKVRKLFPDLFIVANINPNSTPEMALAAINMIKANALAIHVNGAHELAMKEGDRDFTNWLTNIKAITRIVKIPLIAKEIGNGMHVHTIKLLHKVGVKYIDVGGSGGTDFNMIETIRAKKNVSILTSLHISTVEALLDSKDLKGITIYAGGGIRDALDIIKSLALGAKACGMANYFLQLTKLKSFIKMTAEVDQLIANLRLIMTVIGATNITDVNYSHLYSSSLKN